MSSAQPTVHLPSRTELSACPAPTLSQVLGVHQKEVILRFGLVPVTRVGGYDAVIYEKKKGIPVSDQADEVLSKLTGRARDVVRVGIRSNARKLLLLSRVLLMQSHHKLLLWLRLLRCWQRVHLTVWTEYLPSSNVYFLISHSSLNMSERSMLSAQEQRVMQLEEWEERWQQEKIGFHQLAVHKMLENNIDKVVAGRTRVKFFFPLCGKAVDMKWLSDSGHSVVGVEQSEKGIRQFFEESNMSFSEEPVPNVPGAKVFRNSEKSVSLYNCDIYKFSSSLEGQFGAIWDRGAFVAINPKDREKYAALMVSLMAPDCRYLLDTLLYNPQLYQGPPFFVPDEQLLALFGPSCDIELVQEADALNERAKNWGLDSLTEKVHMLLRCQGFPFDPPLSLWCLMSVACTVVETEQGVATDTNSCVIVTALPPVRQRERDTVQKLKKVKQQQSVFIRLQGIPTAPSVMLAAQQNKVMALTDWDRMWQRGRPGFHQTTVNRLLEINIDKVVAGRTGVRFFFPLCGKAVDMKWLADAGHSVVGVEFAEKACRQFFEENHMSFTEDSVPTIPGAKVFRNTEKTVTLYQCNIYSFNSSLEGQFGAIWDRGALVAINPKDREKYAALLTSLMAPDCRFLLDTLIYNPEKYSGPPFFVPDEQVHSLFGSVCDIQELQKEDALTEDFKSWGMDYLMEKIHLLVCNKS
uniref:thiopurine S-methyltransferase n=1 Tax=Knipowitschia caucasica TaxID=637954 RepID=A0AAV2K0Y5_KNICA